MKAVSRFGGGKVAAWFNGWWVVGLALLLGVAGPLYATFRAGRPSDDKGGVERAVAWLWGGGGGAQAPQDAQAGAAEVVERQGGMSQRMQLTVALATAASLRLRYAQIGKGMPVDTGALYEGMRRERVQGRPLLPSDVRTGKPVFSEPREGSTKDAVILSSSEGLFLLRYLPERGGLVEVISVSRRSDAAEPAMMARMPDDKLVFGDGVGFYTRWEGAVPAGPELAGPEAGERGGLEGMLLPAFGDVAGMIGAGWRVTKLTMPEAKGGPAAAAGR